MPLIFPLAGIGVSTDDLQVSDPQGLRDFYVDAESAFPRAAKLDSWDFCWGHGFHLVTDPHSWSWR